MTSFAIIAILDPVLWIILSNMLDLDGVSKRFSKVLSEGECDHHALSGAARTSRRFVHGSPHSSLL